ncbi:hypothetical protein V866_002470 [Kwoniella sp. B9012]
MPSPRFPQLKYTPKNKDEPERDRMNLRAEHRDVSYYCINAFGLKVFVGPTFWLSQAVSRAPSLKPPTHATQSSLAGFRISILPELG